MRALPLAATIAFLGLVSQASFAQGPRFPASHANLGSTVYDSAAVDIDADGWPDLIAGSDGLRIRRGLGDGSFGPIETWFAGKAVKGLTIVDVDGDSLALADYDVDGELDIAVAMGAAVRVDLLFGDGSGAFTPSESYAVDESGQYLRTGDWDQDGAPDLIAVAQSLSALHNNTLDAWKSLGQGHPGFDGIPWLHGDGVPDTGQLFSIHIEHGRPSTPVVLVAGLTTLMAPFKGGTLVPHPDLLLSGLVIDSAGELSLSGTWPAIPGDPKLYLQAWLMDGAADHGLAGSGALRILDQ